MNNRYQKAMDRLHMSSSAKQRLIQSLTAPAAKTSTAYRRAMDRRHLSPEKKRQIIKACLTHKNRLEKRRRYLHYTANAAACFLLVTASAPVLRQLTPTLPPPANPPAIQPAENTPGSHTTAAAVQASPAPAAEQAASPSPSPKAPSSKAPETSARALTAPEPPAVPPKGIALPEKTVNTSQAPIAMQTPVPPTPEPSSNAVSATPDAAIDHHTPSPTQLPAQFPVADGSTTPSPSEPPVQIGSPIQSFPSQTALEEQLTFPLYAPAYLPEGYRPSGFSLISGSLAEITYRNGADTLLFRCREGSGDCSGSYEIYTHIKEVYTGDTAITLKTDGSLGFLAIWEYEAMSYALTGNQILEEEEILKIIQSTIPSIAVD